MLCSKIVPLIEITFWCLSKLFFFFHLFDSTPINIADFVVSISFNLFFFSYFSFFFIQLLARFISLRSSELNDNFFEQDYGKCHDYVFYNICFSSEVNINHFFLIKCLEIIVYIMDVLWYLKHFYERYFCNKNKWQNVNRIRSTDFSFYYFWCCSKKLFTFYCKYLCMFVWSANNNGFIY